MDRRLGGLQDWSGCSGEEKNSLTLDKKRDENLGSRLAQ
jgi:hypothetical protein